MAMKRQRIEGPLVARSATIESSDAEKRTIRVSFSSELPVLRASWWDDPWLETLGHDDGEADLERLNANAPVLYNHDRWDRDNRIGVVENAWIDKGRGYADIRISQRADVEGIWQDIRDGILTNVSVGYSINERTLTKAGKDGPDAYRVTSWTPLEISLVDIPADHTVGVGRSKGGSGERFRVIDLPEQPGSTERGTVMADEAEDNGTPETKETRQQSNNPVNLDEVRATAKREAIEQDRARRTAIAELCAPLRARHGFISEIESRAVAGDMTADQVSVEILRKLGEGAEPLGFDPTPDAQSRCSAGDDQIDKRRTAALDWLLVRSNQPVIQLDDGKSRRIDLSGNPFRGATLLQIAERSLRAIGINPDGMDKLAIVGRAFQSTSDFPVLLEEAIHKTLLNAYRTAPDTWSRFCKTGTASDFRAQNRYRVGSIGNYDTLGEHGEFKRKAIPDGERSSITIGTRGNIIGVTRQVIINDDLGALTDLAMWLGRAGKRTIEASVYSALAENGGAGPTMNDGKALFHADHGNVEATTVGAPSMATFEASRIKMAQQMDISGLDYLDIRPSIWLGPLGLGGEARTVNDAQYDPDTASKLQRPNKVRGIVSDIIDTPRLSGTPWYLFADPMDAAVLEVAFLDGQQEPYTETKDGWDVDGAEIKARLDFGVAAVDYRGAIKNNGA
ncbi:prohead protease/major capsid protein fusion protein [Thiorhodococcus fuscus]|uniref:Prohead protease/major capsid protein fusion protein n=1 Tax=Thiorhodococcus fuscus TaxID=527200 RepID=A0ABW4YAC2_9GAMM